MIARICAKYMIWAVQFKMCNGVYFVFLSLNYKTEFDCCKRLIYSMDKAKCHPPSWNICISKQICLLHYIMTINQETNAVIYTFI